MKFLSSWKVLCCLASPVEHLGPAMTCCNIIVGIMIEYTNIIEPLLTPGTSRSDPKGRKSVYFFLGPECTSAIAPNGFQ